MKTTQSDKMNKIDWLATVVSFSTPNNDCETFTVRLADIEKETGKSRQNCKNNIKSAISKMEKAGIIILCPDIKTREEIQAAKEEEERNTIHFTVENKTTDIVDIEELLPASFGKHLKKNGHLFFQAAMIYLQDYKPIDIGVVKRYDRIIQTGKIVKIGEKTSPFYAIFNVRFENKIVDLLYCNGNVPCGIETIITLTEKRTNYLGKDKLQTNALVKNTTMGKMAIVRDKNFDDNDQEMQQYLVKAKIREEAAQKREEYKQAAKDKRAKDREDKRAVENNKLADMNRRMKTLRKQKAAIQAAKEKKND